MARFYRSMILTTGRSKVATDVSDSGTRADSVTMPGATGVGRATSPRHHDIFAGTSTGHSKV